MTGAQALVASCSRRRSRAALRNSNEMNSRSCRSESKTCPCEAELIFNHQPELGAKSEGWLAASRRTRMASVDSPQLDGIARASRSAPTTGASRFRPVSLMLWARPRYATVEIRSRWAASCSLSQCCTITPIATEPSRAEAAADVMGWLAHHSRPGGMKSARTRSASKVSEARTAKSVVARRLRLLCARSSRGAGASCLDMASPGGG